MYCLAILDTKKYAFPTEIFFSFNFNRREYLKNFKDAVNSIF